MMRAANLLVVFVTLLSTSLVQAETTLAKLGALKGPFEVPPLGYALDALEPIVDKATMELHYGKHHKAYVDKLNAELKDTSADLTAIFSKMSTYPDVIRNNAGGHWNHSFFWSVMTPDANQRKMPRRLQKEIEIAFGSLEKFQEQMEARGTGLFGSGWVWLIRDQDKKLKITSTSNQDNPLMDIATDKGTPVFAIDVWEHAYYLKYQNRRGEYLKGFWPVVNWQQVDHYDQEVLKRK